MQLYAIVSDGVNGPEPLYNYGTGAPTVYADEQQAIAEVADLNANTHGGYRYIEFETED